MYVVRVGSVIRQVNRYLQGTIPDAHCFFTTMLPSRVRARYADPEKFQEKIYQVCLALMLFFLIYLFIYFYYYRYLLPLHVLLLLLFLLFLLLLLLLF
jgi:cell division protein FtsW (lipid II flippase)